eukprot:CAMPEP_0178380116 /NCGR_PEP_ID=MMETSP0689_2-20121128/5293_1 /TAXON_ID=160604 /ORGANISM="Amphidinium massartii, Strain CS-259" /LENGTH=193 /DNA_ID=CAMNT_0020000241 /DNA_START=789 /DNA_END=1371 /DNA_ORIENTATION=-
MSTTGIATVLASNASCLTNGCNQSLLTLLSGLKNAIAGKEAAFTPMFLAAEDPGASNRVTNLTFTFSEIASSSCSLGLVPRATKMISCISHAGVKAITDKSMSRTCSKSSSSQGTTMDTGKPPIWSLPSAFPCSLSASPLVDKGRAQGLSASSQHQSRGCMPTPSNQVQSPLHQAAPCPCGHSPQLLAQWLPQ